MWKKISKTDFSAASSVSIDGCFSSVYTHYLVVRNLLGSAGDQYLSIRLRSASTDASGADYRRQYVFAASTGVSGSRSTGETSWTQALGYAETAAFGFSGTRVSNPFDTVRTTAWVDFSYDADASICLQRQVFAHDLTTSYDGISVIPNSGTITGSITVYGLKES